jgi:NAD(P) transhydrogenase
MNLKGAETRQKGERAWRSNISSMVWLSLAEVIVEDRHTLTRLKGAKFVIAVGSQPARPSYVPLTPGRIIDSDGVLQLPSIPRTMVVGAGIIACEYGAIFATLGTEVTLIDRRDTLLAFVDREIVEILTYYMRKQNMTLRLGETVDKVFIDEHDRIVTALESGNLEIVWP